MLFYLFLDFGHAAHIGLKSFRNENRSVCLQVVFEERDKHSRRSDNSVVEGVCKILVSVFVGNSDFERTQRQRYVLTQLMAEAKQLSVAQLTEKMQAILGTRVTVNHKANHKGKIEIEYYNKEDLDRLIDMILK